jgi:very-short-patch-repair endonuclease
MTAIMNNQPLLMRRRKLRKTQTEAEAKLWFNLRNKIFFNFKFRRQQSVGVYILDFYCSKKKIAIEVDGGQHASNFKYDEARSKYLSSVGIKVIRFWNNDVLNDINAVLEYLRILIESDDDPHPNPLPYQGRGGK